MSKIYYLCTVNLRAHSIYGWAYSTGGGGLNGRHFGLNIYILSYISIKYTFYTLYSTYIYFLYGPKRHKNVRDAFVFTYYSFKPMGL